MLNIRNNARRTLWDPSAAGVRRAGAQQDEAWDIAWRARGPVTSFSTVENARVRGWPCDK